MFAGDACLFQRRCSSGEIGGGGGSGGSAVRDVITAPKRWGRTYLGSLLPLLKLVVTARAAGAAAAAALRNLGPDCRVPSFTRKSFGQQQQHSPPIHRDEFSNPQTWHSHKTRSPQSNEAGSACRKSRFEQMSTVSEKYEADFPVPFEQQQNSAGGRDVVFGVVFGEEVATL